MSRKSYRWALALLFVVAAVLGLDTEVLVKIIQSFILAIDP